MKLQSLVLASVLFSGSLSLAMPWSYTCVVESANSAPVKVEFATDSANTYDLHTTSIEYTAQTSKALPANYVLQFKMNEKELYLKSILNEGDTSREGFVINARKKAGQYVGTIQKFQQDDSNSPQKLGSSASITCK